jgi:hypothetical protein
MRLIFSFFVTSARRKERIFTQPNVGDRPGTGEGRAAMAARPSQTDRIFSAVFPDASCNAPDSYPQTTTHSPHAASSAAANPPSPASSCYCATATGGSGPGCPPGASSGSPRRCPAPRGGGSYSCHCPAWSSSLGLATSLARPGGTSPKVSPPHRDPSPNPQASKPGHPPSAPSTTGESAGHPAYRASQQSRHWTRLAYPGRS